MSEITFTELRQFNSGASDILAINKFNGLIFLSLDNGEIWTRNSLTGRFLLNSTFSGGDSVRAFKVIPTSTNSLIVENTLWAVTGGTDGKLYIYDNDGTWTQKADTADATCTSLEFYQDNLYYGTSDGEEVFKWDGSVQTVSLPTASTSGPVNALHLFGSDLFAGANDVAFGAEIWIFDNAVWTLEDNLDNSFADEVFSFVEFEGDLYCGSNRTGGTENLWRRNGGTWLALISAQSLSDVLTLTVFKGRIYMGGNNDAIVATNGITQIDIANVLSGINNQFSSFTDDSTIYFGSGANTTIAKLLSFNNECSGQVLISGASPFGWNVGDCNITPEICLIEDGCFCQIINTGDTTTIQIQFNGAGTPRLSVVDLDTGLEVSNTAFVNIVGIIWEVDIDVSTLNCVNIQLAVTTKLLNEGEWLDKSIATSSPVLGIYVPSLTRIYATCAILQSSSDFGDSYTGKSFPSTGTGDITVATGTGAQDNVFVFRTNGFGSSSDNLNTYDIDNTPAAGGPVVAANFGANDIISLNQNGGARISANGGSTWATPGFSPPTNPGAYNDVFMTSVNDIYTCDEDGKIFSTGDAGATAWVEDHDEGASNDLRGIFLNSTTLGWCVGHNGTILKTTDGSTWISKTSGTAQDLNSVWFANTLIGWAVGENSTVLKTIDGGEIWVAQTIPTSANLNKVDGFSIKSSTLKVHV